MWVFLTVSPVPRTITSYSSFIFPNLYSSAPEYRERRKWRSAGLEMRRGCGSASGASGGVASRLSITWQKRRKASVWKLSVTTWGEAYMWGSERVRVIIIMTVRTFFSSRLVIVCKPLCCVVCLMCISENSGYACRKHLTLCLELSNESSQLLKDEVWPLLTDVPTQSV